MKESGNDKIMSASLKKIVEIKVIVSFVVRICFAFFHRGEPGGNLLAGEELCLTLSIWHTLIRISGSE